MHESAPVKSTHDIYFESCKLLSSHKSFELNKNKNHGHQSAVKNDKLLQSVAEQLRRMRKSQDAKNCLSIHHNMRFDTFIQS